jgi:hypothetical protein
MTKIITIRYQQKERVPYCASVLFPTMREFTICADPERTLNQAMDLLADSYKKYGNQADFGIVDSSDISDICGSSQCMFDQYVEDAFQRLGITGVKAQGLIGGSYDAVLDMVREYDEHIEYLDGIEFAENPVLYKFERK